MTRRVVRHAEEEKSLLGHQAVEPAHLLLALLTLGWDLFRLDHFDQDREEVRRRVLQTLSESAESSSDARMEQPTAEEGQRAVGRLFTRGSSMPVKGRGSQAFETLTEGLVERQDVYTGFDHGLLLLR
ncbi:hypothetical protein AK812_SmicGene23370 [Symbiodinium microadriaticum]|uniref:Uncharacterized protein n=1 Tax=Symbiodinium microadriaticum TaxID=2951 RepID=A0A1Q9DHE3_SYMMI|nr:hypothetical protein AK812_SmicGene23370 [Symbiodinium microadriaticum]